MPQFILHRNYVLRTTNGHAISFKKGKPTNVPPVCIEDAVGIGAVAVDAKDGDILGEEAKPQPAMPPAERKEKVFEAFAMMKARKERGDFTASGVPDGRRLRSMIGFEVTSKERDAYWTEYREQVQEEKDQANLDVAFAASDMAEAG